MKGFQIAGGSVPGTAHTKPGQPGWTNNQDAFAWHIGGDFIVAVVCDGCSSTPHPEVGAKIGAQMVARFLSGYLTYRHDAPWQRRIREALLWTQKKVLHGLSTCAREIGGFGSDEYERILLDYFLFTIVGAVLTPDESAIFSLGDGVYAVNDNVTVIGPYEGNAPPYLAYAQMQSVLYPDALDLRIRAVLATKEMTSMLIGTDGLADFIAAAASPLPGKSEALGHLAQFWTDGRFVNNPDAVRRRLALANREHVEDGRIKKGLLPDDTTLVVIRREPKREG